jgi:glutathione S-transferase
VTIFHLATPDQWADAQATGQIAPPSLTAEGFVHCSTQDQLAGTIERHFAGVDELVVLRLHDAGLEGHLRWEESHPGASYPHVHRAIALDEVAEVIPWRRHGETPLPR